MSGNVLLEHGTFYDGERTTPQPESRSRTKGDVAVLGRAQPVAEQGGAGPTVHSLPRSLAPARTYTVTPLMFVSAFLQYESSEPRPLRQLRFRWEYRPGSELFVVYQRRTRTPLSLPNSTRTRSLIFKINRLFRP